MNPKTLLDAQASVRDFLNEAEFCAQNGKGFAAMSTLFPVILAVSEAVKTKPLADKDLIDAFVASMTDKSTWLVAPSGIGSITDSDITQKLTELRNALTHELSLPVDIILVDTVRDVHNNLKAPRNNWYIGTTEFVRAVQDSAARLILANANTRFDPRPRGATPRGPAVGTTVSWEPPASGVDVS